MTLAKKQDSIGLRINSEHKEIIRMAAEFTGQDLTSYLVSTALEKAKKGRLNIPVVINGREYFTGDVVPQVMVHTLSDIASFFNSCA